APRHPHPSEHLDAPALDAVKTGRRRGPSCSIEASAMYRQPACPDLHAPSAFVEPPSGGAGDLDVHGREGSRPERALGGVVVGTLHRLWKTMLRPGAGFGAVPVDEKCRNW